MESSKGERLMAVLLGGGGKNEGVLSKVNFKGLGRPSTNLLDIMMGYIIFHQDSDTTST